MEIGSPGGIPPAADGWQHSLPAAIPTGNGFFPAFFFFNCRRMCCNMSV